MEKAKVKVEFTDFLRAIRNNPVGNMIAGVAAFAFLYVLGPVAIVPITAYIGHKIWKAAQAQAKNRNLEKEENPNSKIKELENKLDVQNSKIKELNNSLQEQNNKNNILQAENEKLKSAVIENPNHSMQANVMAVSKNNSLRHDDKTNKNQKKIPSSVDSNSTNNAKFLALAVGGPVNKHQDRRQENAKIAAKMKTRESQKTVKNVGKRGLGGFSMN